MGLARKNCQVQSRTNENLLVAAGLVAGGAARVVDGIGAARGAGGARIPELAPAALPPPLPNDLKFNQ